MKPELIEAPTMHCAPGFFSQAPGSCSRPASAEPKEKPKGQKP